MLFIHGLAVVSIGVGTLVFQGASSLSLDAKGRLSVPTRHREVLSATAGGQLTITKHPHGCLMVFPRTEWERFRERIAQLPMEAQWWKRIFLGNAMDVEMDASGRVLVSPELRQAAGISRDTILLGMGMPTTAAYAVAASVVAPGLINIGIQPLVAHFFVFYFAVVSAITHTPASGPFALVTTPLM